MESEEMMNSLRIAIELEDFKEAIGKMRKQKADPPNREFEQPRIISIGAFNWQKYSKMDDRKSHYVDAILRRNPNLEIIDYYMKLKELEDEVRSSYEGASKDALKKLLEIMMLDGCFIVEYFLCIAKGVDELNKNKDTRQKIEHDMLLLQNQLPSSVLQCIYFLATGEPPSSLYAVIRRHFIQSSFFQIKPSTDHQKVGPESGQSPFSCCDIISQHFIQSSCFQIEPSTDHQKVGPESTDNLLHLFHSMLIPIETKSKKQELNVRSATELHAAGIKFDVKKKGNFAVAFHRGFYGGTVEIPPLIVDKFTVSFIKNLVQFEEVRSDVTPGVTSYVKFLDDIINTADDVALLRKRGIIRHTFGSDNEVASLVNTIGGSNFDRLTPSMISVCKDVNKYYDARRHHWWASLMRSHFSSPWSCLKLLAAVIILILTFTQTFFSVYAYYRPRGS